jgi:hypothetical protein
VVFRNVFAVADRSLVDVEAVSGTSDHTNNEDAEKRQPQLPNGEAIVRICPTLRFEAKLRGRCSPHGWGRNMVVLVGGWQWLWDRSLRIKYR